MAARASRPARACCARRCDSPAPGQPRRRRGRRARRPRPGIGRRAAHARRRCHASRMARAPASTWRSKARAPRSCARRRSSRGSRRGGRRGAAGSGGPRSSRTTRPHEHRARAPRVAAICAAGRAPPRCVEKPRGRRPSARRARRRSRRRAARSRGASTARCRGVGEVDLESTPRACSATASARSDAPDPPGPPAGATDRRGRDAPGARRRCTWMSMERDARRCAGGARGAGSRRRRGRPARSRNVPARPARDRPRARAEVAALRPNKVRRIGDCDGAAPRRLLTRRGR